jgi:hypothetical protein
MKLAPVALFTLAILLCGAEQKRKPGKGPDIELIDVACQRTEDRVLLDGRIRNASNRPLRKVSMIFRFMTPGRKVIATKYAELDEELIEPDAEAEFHMQVRDPARAVEFDVNAEDGSGRELRFDRSGPFKIE